MHHLRMDYSFDFNLFARRGRIGAVACIELPLSNFEIGSHCPITFCTDGESATAIIDGMHLQVYDGEVVDLRLLEDHAILIRLIVDGECVDSVEVVPTVVVPELVSLNVPTETNYSSSELVAVLRTRETTEVRAFYKRANQAPDEWLPLLVDPITEFLIPIVPEPHELIVRVELRSKHSRWTQRAIRVFERRVLVKHPEPTCSTDSLDDITYRFQDKQIEFECNWVSAVRIVHGNRNHEAQRVGVQFRAVITMNTEQVGQQSVLVEMLALDGSIRQMSFVVTVQPRELAFDISVSRLGYELWIRGATQVRLSIRSRSTELLVPEIGGVISHGYFLPTQAQLLMIDDLGVEICHPLVLEPPEQEFAALPLFSEISGWRI